MDSTPTSESPELGPILAEADDDGGVTAQDSAPPELTTLQMVVRLEVMCEAVADSLRAAGDPERDPELDPERDFLDASASVMGLRAFLHRLPQLVCKWDADEADADLAGRAVALVGRAKDWVLALHDVHQLRDCGDELEHLAVHLNRTKGFKTHSSSSSLAEERDGQREEAANQEILEEVRAAAREVKQRLKELERQADAEPVPEALDQLPAERAAAMSTSIVEIIAENSPGESESSDKQALHIWLQDKLQALVPGAVLEGYGSQASGLNLRGADLDLCFMLDDEMLRSVLLPSDQSERERETQTILYLGEIFDGIGLELQQSGGSIEVQKIVTARVPILTLKIAGLPFLSAEQAAGAAVVNECDICVGHPLPQRNTALLRTYAEIDPRAKQLILAVKVWAKEAGVADSTNGMLSSYGWSLLCVFYLQQCEPPVLPVLQSSTLIGTRWRQLELIDGCDVSFCQDTTEAHTSLAPNHNDATVAELLEGFFHFFGWRDLSKAVVSVRLGKIYRRDLRQNKTKWRMCIEDPFELSRDLGDAISCSEGQREITKALRQAAVAVRSGSAGGWVPQERRGVVHVCHNCCEAGHSQRECPHDHWPVELFCFSCGKAGHKSNECPGRGLGDDSDSGTLTRTGSGLRLLNGMRPFPPGFDPRVEMKALPIPDQFEDNMEYFDTMSHNILFEVSACVRNGSNRGVVEIEAEMCECETDEDGRPQYILRFPPCDSGEYSWYNHLLQTESGECVIVRDEKPEYIVEFGARPADRLVKMQEMNWAPVGTKLKFKDYGYQGNLIGSYLAIEQLRRMDDADLPPLLEPILSAGEDVIEGEFASDDNESERDLNVEQLAVLTGLRDNLTVIQGPPGTGKTRLISNMLACKIPDGTSALVTSESNQAIDNLCEVLARSCPEVDFVVLGKPQNFLSKGRIALFYHSLEVQTVFEFCPAMRELKDDQLLELILAVGIGGEAPFNMRAPSSVRAHLKRPWVLLQETIERHEKQDPFGNHQEVLDLLVEEAEAAVIDRCNTFVCTVGSVERAKKGKFADKNIRTAIVDESSLLPEFSIPRLLVLQSSNEEDEPWIENLILVGDHKQLEAFSKSPGGRPGSLMQRCAEVSGCRMLVEQYRMDPAICAVVTTVFYGGMLRTNPAVAIQRRADRRAGTSPVTVHDISDGAEQHPPNSMSLYNEAEANAILKWYNEQRDCTNGKLVGRTDRSRLRDERQAEREKSILIVTLYSAQERLLQQLLPADTEHHSFEKYGSYKDHNLRIVTVDKSQGSEGDIVALSCVRANFNRNIGHARDPKRANVALSRAREELHIFAHMQTVAHQRPWSQAFAAIDGTCAAARVARMDDPFEQDAALGMVYDDDYDDAELRALGQFPALP